MPQIGWFEILVIVVLAILIIGPKDFPIVLKKIGAIFPPKQKPPYRLLGIKGISLPICQSTEFVADLREEPVPTTSPT